MKIYFITTAYLKSNSVINQNVDDSLLNSAILDAQNIHLQTALGSVLFRKFESLISTNTITNIGNKVYKDLLDDYITQMLVNWTVYEALPNIRYKVMNKSVSGQTSDNSTPVEPDDLNFYRNSVKDKAEFYTQRLIDHLMFNSAIYPEYIKFLNEGVVPVTNSYFSGIQLDDNKDAYRRSMGYNDGIVYLHW